ncbi:MAG: hypothetical protein ACJ8FY_16715 [Gemmataceae bacterium]
MSVKRFLLLIVGSLLFWLLVAILAHQFNSLSLYLFPERAITLPEGYVGNPAVVFSLSAVLICLIPTTGTLYWGMRALQGSPEQQLTLVMGGTGIRMLFVLLVGLALYKLVPYYEANQGFWIWLLVFYLFTLALEMALLLSGRNTNKA